MLPFATLSILQGWIYLWHNVVQADSFSHWVRSTTMFRNLAYSHK